MGKGKALPLRPICMRKHANALADCDYEFEKFAKIVIKKKQYFLKLCAIFYAIMYIIWVVQ